MYHYILNCFWMRFLNLCNRTPLLLKFSNLMTFGPYWHKYKACHINCNVLSWKLCHRPMNRIYFWTIFMISPQNDVSRAALYLLLPERERCNFISRPHAKGSLLKALFMSVVGRPFFHFCFLKAWYHIMANRRRLEGYYILTDWLDI